jgi:glutamyl-tRNA reductase
VPIVCIGLSHHTAPVEVRERHSFPASQMSEALIALRDYEAVREALMLGTCNRLEIYAELDDYEIGIAQIKRFLQNFRHGEVSDMESYLYTLLGTQAVDHLFRVSTGLDSMLIGEAEILGQVKDAYIQAQRARSLGKILHYLFREALNAGKTARSHTWISSESVSAATAAIDLAKQHLGTLRGKSVVIIGAGTMGTLAAKRLKSEGAGQIVVRAGRPADLPSLIASMAEADVVVTSTGAPHFVVTAGNVDQAMGSRPQRPLFIVDIAVPRDVEPEAAQIANVKIVDIDGLKDVVAVSLERRREAIPLVEEIISEYVGRFGQWYQARVSVPVISSLTQKAETIREAEVERLFARCPELTERERLLITNMSLTVISRLLHSVVTKIRDKTINNRAEALTHAQIIEELFELQLRHELSAHSTGDVALAQD